MTWIAEIKRDCDTKRTGMRGGQNIMLHIWPIGFMVQMIERKAKKEPLSDEALERLRAMLAWDEMTRAGDYGTDFAKVKTRIVILGGRQWRRP